MNGLLIALFDPTQLTATASLLWATALLVLGILLLDVLFRDRGDTRGRTPVEVARRQRFREASPTFRWLEPLVDELATLSQWLFPSPVRAVEHDLAIIEQQTASSGAEWVGCRATEAAFIGLGLGFLAPGWVFAFFLALCATASYAIFRILRLHARSLRTVRRIQHDLPLAIDLLALTMEAGATFPDALASLAQEMERLPIGPLVRRLNSELACGLPRRQALERLRDLYRSDALSEIVMAIVEGEELGTPLVEILRLQAEQMRLKRTQWIEAATARAQVHMFAPAFISMIASMAIIISPFLLSAIESGSIFMSVK